MCPHRIREERAMADRSSLEATKVEAAIGNRILAEVGLAAGVRASLGHVSMRVSGDPNLFVVKGRGYRMDVLSRMRPEDMVVCDLEGNWVDGPPYSLQRSEEHTSELQSLRHLVCRLLLEKKKKNHNKNTQDY